jgi:hypothetical protein
LNLSTLSGRGAFLTAVLGAIVAIAGTYGGSVVTADILAGAASRTWLAVVLLYIAAALIGLLLVRWSLRSRLSRMGVTQPGGPRGRDGR